MSLTTHTTIRWLLFGVALAFLTMIVYAAATASLTKQGPAIGGLIWGKITLVDLYLGFFIALLLLWFLEPNRRYVLVFSLAFLVMGNWLLCWYLAWRWPHLRGITLPT
ncbi:MAG: hypothetical protein WED11_06805 [Natronospirillum sp.]